MTKQPVSVQLVLVAHAPLASALASAARSILGPPPLATTCIDFENDGDDAPCHRAIAKALDAGAGVLVLVDVVGASPCNSVQRAVAGRADVAIVAGLSLAMLLRVYNYHDADLATLTERATESAARATLRLTMSDDSSRL